MAKALKTVGTVLGGIALVATGIGAVLGAPLIVGGIGVAAAASVGAAAAGLASTALTPGQKPPPARGSVSQLLVDPDAPQPYVMGEGYFAGVLRHRTSYGGTVDDIPNPYLFDVVDYSGGGPMQSIAPRVDFGAVPSWYSGYLYTDTQLGACPEANALAPHWAGAPGWGAAYKLSGQAAIGWNYKFDKNGKKFASGLPQTGAEGRWVRAYDPRKDSTFPGGSGTHRLGIEATYEWTENPALHAGMYAYGRYQNGKRTMGMGLPADGIDWEVVAAWASTCEANGWRMFGVVFEPGDRWGNLIDICAAGGAEPVPGAVLSFHYSAPRVALDTIREKDIADQDASVCPMQSYRDRINVVIPKRLFPELNWELLPDVAVSVPEYVTEDGEDRPQEWPFNFVKDAKQAAQLAAYKLVDARELHPIELVCMPRLRGYRPGDCLHLDLPQMGLDHDAVILWREFDPPSMTVRLVLMSETPSKHAFALGEQGAAPPSPALAMTAQERDETAAENVPLDPNATEGATLPNPDGTGGNITHPGGDPVLPGFLRNDMLEFSPDGIMGFRPLDGSPLQEIGQVEIEAIGGARQESLADAEAAIAKGQAATDRLAEAALRLASTASETRALVRDAGIYVDPATGQVRIYALDQTTERVSETEIRLNAAEASILTRATVTYVNQKIAEAVLDPSQVAELEDLYLRMSAAETAIDGNAAAITSKADLLLLEAAEGRITTAEQDIDALEGVVSTKVDTVTFDGLATRVTTAEQTLSALGDVAQYSQVVSTVRLIDRKADDSAKSALEALLNADKERRDRVAALAEVRREVVARIVDGAAAEASARDLLVVRIAAAEGAIVSEQLARTDGDNALAQSIANVQAVVDENAAAIETEQTARIDGDEALSQQVTALSSTVSDNTAAIENEETARSDADSALAQSGRIVQARTDANAHTSLEALLDADKERRDRLATVADVRQELTARVVDQALAEATARQQLVARLGAAETAIVLEQVARAAADAAISQMITSLSATVDANAGAIGSEATTRADADSALASDISAIQATANDNAAAILAEQTARSDADGALAQDIQTVSSNVNGLSASVTTLSEAVDGVEARAGVRLDVNGRITGWVANNDGEEGNFVILADNFAVITPDGSAGLSWTKDINNRSTLLVNDGAGSTVEIGWCP